MNTHPSSQHADPRNEGKHRSATDVKLLNEIEQRGLEIRHATGAEARQAAQLDVNALTKIRGEEARASALTSMGWTADGNSQYRMELRLIAPKVAAFAERLQSAELDGAYGGTQAADGARHRQELMVELRALALVRALEAAPENQKGPLNVKGDHAKSIGNQPGVTGGHDHRSHTSAAMAPADPSRPMRRAEPDRER